MRIELCEDNGEFNNGIPTLVVLLLDGKKRIPYPADRTIQDLYRDVAKLKPSEGRILEAPVQDVSVSTDIEREDIVVCTKVTPRDPGTNQDIIQGNEYRVIEVIRQNKIITGYEVIDDDADFRIRIPVTPDEIKLVRKAPPKKPRNQNFEVTQSCGCGALNVLELNGNRYETECIKCGAFLTEQRKEQNVNSI
jgi:hypothetical protein